MYKKRRPTYLILATPIIMAGCMAAPPVYNYSPQQTDTSTPVGEERTAYVGDAIVQHSVQTMQDFLLVEKETHVGYLGSYIIGTGLYLKIGENDESAFFRPENEFEGGGHMTKSALSDPRKAVQAYKAVNRLCGVSVFDMHVCDTKAKYKFVSKTLDGAKLPQKVLIYNGKTASQIRVGYRETSVAGSQPTFTNDVIYDLSQSKLITYKGVRVEILEATNEFIRYRVLQGFTEGS